MNNEQSELLFKEKEDYNYQCFDSMMNSLFDLANELHDRLEEDEELTDAEAVFLRNFDTYIDSWSELDDSDSGEEVGNEQSGI